MKRIAIAIAVLLAVCTKAATLSPQDFKRKASVALTPTPNLYWNRNPEPDIAGYRVYTGPSSRRYTNAVDVGQATNTRTRIALGTNYFSITAINSNALESDFSAEVSVVRWPHTAVTLRVPTNRWWIARGPEPGRLTNWFNANGPTNVVIGFTNGAACFMSYRPFYVSPIMATAKGTLPARTR